MLIDKLKLASKCFGIRLRGIHSSADFFRFQRARLQTMHPSGDEKTTSTDSNEFAGRYALCSARVGCSCFVVVLRAEEGRAYCTGTGITPRELAATGSDLRFCQSTDTLARPRSRSVMTSTKNRIVPPGIRNPARWTIKSSFLKDSMSCAKYAYETDGG